MFDFLKNRAAIILAVASMVVSGCTSLGLTPLPNPYEGTTSVADTTLTTLKVFGATQDVLIENCEPVVAGTDAATICVGLITTEQTLRPAVTAAGLVGAEYADIDARIKEAGPSAPVEWLALAAETAGRLEKAYGPVRQDVDTFIRNVEELTD